MMMAQNTPAFALLFTTRFVQNYYSISFFLTNTAPPPILDNFTQPEPGSDAQKKQ
jgi:hypothetical protein